MWKQSSALLFSGAITSLAVSVLGGAWASFPMFPFCSASVCAASPDIKDESYCKIHKYYLFFILAHMLPSSHPVSISVAFMGHSHIWIQKAVPDGCYLVAKLRWEHHATVSLPFQIMDLNARHTWQLKSSANTKRWEKNSANYAVQQEINMTVYSNTDM